MQQIEFIILCEKNHPFLQIKSIAMGYTACFLEDLKII